MERVKRLNPPDRDGDFIQTRLQFMDLLFIPNRCWTGYVLWFPLNICVNFFYYIKHLKCVWNSYACCYLIWSNFNLFGECVNCCKVICVGMLAHTASVITNWRSDNVHFLLPQAPTSVLLEVPAHVSSVWLCILPVPGVLKRCGALQCLMLRVYFSFDSWDCWMKVLLDKNYGRI